MARDVKDCAILLEAMSGFDPKDSTSLDLPVPNWETGLSGDLRGKRIGIPKEYRVDGMPGEIDALWEKGIAWVKDAGAEVVEVSLPHTKYALPAYYIVAPAEASSKRSEASRSPSVQSRSPSSPPPAPAVESARSSPTAPTNK